MDIFLMISASILVTIFTVIAICIWRLFRLESGTSLSAAELIAADAEERTRRDNARRQQQTFIGGGMRRVRNRFLPRRDQRQDEMEGDQDFEENSDEEFMDDGDLGIPADKKIGTKKRAKLEEKARKRADREAELREREEQKRRDAIKEQKQKEDDAKKQKEEAEQLEKERQEREEQERKEYEAYLALKETFSIEEEGFDQIGESESANLLHKFVEYIKKMKVLNMDELAAHFQLRTVDAIDRIKYLMDNGTLTGVIDDRGKFIYITMDELKAVAKFFNQRGRVRISELADYSNKLIKLEGSD